MNSNRPFLDNMFNQYLSSVYKTDNSMLNSNLFVLFNAYSEVFEDILRNINDAQNNVYIETATQSGLENNFGLPINLPKPPKLNTITNGGDIYRAILKTLYAYLLQGATVDTMDSAISLCLSILETDPGTTNYQAVNNYTEFSIFDSSVQLTWPAVAVNTGTQTIIGPAIGGNQILIFPTGLTPYDYNDSTKTVFFSGIATTGIEYRIQYFISSNNKTGTNWMNLSNRLDKNVSPMNLKAGAVNTYYNPEFSYWWNNYNYSGNGVFIDEFSITSADSSLIWRLPSKSIQYVSPYSQRALQGAYDFYNESGLSYDINFVNAVNPDVLFEDNPTNYQNQVSANIVKNYFVRYSVNNNGPNIALFPYSGSFFKYQKQYYGITFPSPNFGELDFFEKGESFDPTDLFGYGTKNVWLNVPNVNGAYVLNNTNLYTRPFSLHERVLFEENFESGEVTRLSTNYPNGISVTELVGTPTYDKSDCLMVASSGVILGSGVVFQSGIALDILSTYGSINGGEITTEFGTLNTSPLLTPITTVYSTGVSTSTYVYPNIDKNTSLTINNGTTEGLIISGLIYDLSNKVQVDFFDPINSGTNIYIDVTRTGNSNYLKFRFGIETGNTIVFNQSTSLSLQDTKPYGFVETYFGSSGSMNYATIPSGDWVLVPGNPFSASSDQSLGTNSNATLEFNVESGIVKDADYISIEYSDSLITSQIFSGPLITLSTLKLVSPNNVWANDRASLLVLNNTTDSFLIQRDEQVSAGINSLTTNNYGTLLPVDVNIWDTNTAGSGPHKLEVIRGVGIYLDGVQVSYSPLLFGNWATDNLASFWGSGDLGGDASVLASEAYSPSSSSINSPSSVKITIPSNVTLHHVVFGNKSLREGAQANASLSSSTIFTGNFVSPYFYQLFNSPTDTNPPKVYLNLVPRNSLWSTLSFYFGNDYSRMDCWLDELSIYSSEIGFSGTLAGPSGLMMSQTSVYPRSEFSYFDNIKLSYFDDQALLPSYSGLTSLETDWAGSALDFNAILDNRYLSLEPSPNFQFSVNIKGVSEQYIPIIDGIVDKIKPAHTVAIPIFLFEQELDTTSQVPPPGSDPETDWESGSILKNVEILPFSPSSPGTDSGLITPSGLI